MDTAILSSLRLFFQLCALLAAGAAAGLWLLAWWQRIERRRALARQTMLRRYLHLVVLALLAEREAPLRFPQLRRPGMRMVLAETLARTMRATTGLDAARLQRIVESCGVDVRLLRRIRRTHGARRAHALALLAALPVAPGLAERVVRYGSDADARVRFQVLLIRLESVPARTPGLLSEFGEPLTAAEVAEILAVLRRGRLPVAYDLLLRAPARNARRVGLCVVRQFGIEEAEPLLLELAAQDSASCAEVLDTLCVLRLPLPERALAGRLAALRAPQRRALLRRMVCEGYAPSEVAALFGDEERTYYDTLARGYKRVLV